MICIYSHRVFYFKGDCLKVISATVTLINPQGLHMRPAGVFASEMGKFDCDITVKSGDRQCSGKSPMALMAAGFKCGTEIEITCDGTDEKECLGRAIEIVKNGLGEPLAC